MGASIGTRLLYSIIGSLAILWLCVVLAVGSVINHETEEIFDSSLEETAQRLLSLDARNAETNGLQKPSEISQPTERRGYLTYQVFDRQGKILARSHAAPESPYAVPLQTGHYEVDGQHFYVEAGQGDQHVVVVAEPTTHRRETFYGMLRSLLLPFAALLPIAGFFIYRAVKDAQRSLIQFGDELSTRDSRNLRPLDTASIPDELFVLGEVVNSLLLRLHLALDAERSFTANSAHELRTPIAAALAQLDVLQDEIGETEARRRIASARNMVARLEQMTVKLLQLAKAESGAALDLAKVDLNSLTRMLLRDLLFRSSRQFAFESPPEPVWIRGDVDAIGIALQNLLENADRYATANTTVEIVVERDGRFIIRNDCPPIPDEALTNLRQRFVRASQEYPGTGIGLSIVDTILRQCQAELELHSPFSANGRGFSASIAFQPWPGGAERGAP